MKKIITFALILFTVFMAHARASQIKRESFSQINLAYPGLEQVRELYNLAKYDEAAAALLSYYRSRNRPSTAAHVDSATQLKADNALLHKFQPQKGYGYYDYGADIDWSYWPVKDNEVRWQLHRLGWWPAMGAVYRQSKDEKYAAEWITQFRDWHRKNAFGKSRENDRFAWRALEASERINIYPTLFGAFLDSSHWTPEFLLEFLSSAALQTSYVTQHYSADGNHLLFEAQRVLAVGVYFPEMQAALDWRQSGIKVLNREIKKQVYSDGMQWELSPVYHTAMIEVFQRAFQLAKEAGMGDEFPKNYVDTIEKMIVALAQISYPDYQTPMFGDSWKINRPERVKLFKSWASAFPDNSLIRYFAAEGNGVLAPAPLSTELKESGFYTFRNGWDADSTVLILKASQPGEFHAQPDNGTFELWVKGRNFMPDSGCYIYSGDATVNAMRAWYRQTRVHSTLTLDDKNMQVTKANRQKWSAEDKLDVLTYTNPSYEHLDHQRSILFVEKTFFLVIDRAIGPATGKLGVHFQLKEDSAPQMEFNRARAYTTYGDGNNLLIASVDITGRSAMVEEAGKVSYIYNQEQTRPAFAFVKEKTDRAQQTFATVLLPFSGISPPDVRVVAGARNNFQTGKLDLEIYIDAQKYSVQAALF